VKKTIEKKTRIRNIEQPTLGQTSIALIRKGGAATATFGIAKQLGEVKKAKETIRVFVEEKKERSNLGRKGGGRVKKCRRQEGGKSGDPRENTSLDCFSVAR